MAAKVRLFTGQAIHLAALLLLMAALFGAGRIFDVQEREFLGLETRQWVRLCVANAILHQVFVWFCWRTEALHGLLSHWLGRFAFPLFAGMFAVLILLRPVLLTLLAVSDHGSLPLARTPATLLGLGLLLPVIYLFYSVGRYFGFRRAFGIDHFDPAARSLPLVRQGIFRFSPNGMYLFGFLMLWVPALLLRSSAALGVALFSHLYIWVHYFCTERPDFRLMSAEPELELRDVVEDDLACLFEHQLDPVANQMAAFTAQDPTDREAFLERWARILNDRTITKQVICQAGKVVGHIARFQRDGQTEITYWIARDDWGRGLATRALKVFLQDQPTRPLFARVALDNLASLRVLEKCGFQHLCRELGFANARGEEIEEATLRLD